MEVTVDTKDAVSASYAAKKMRVTRAAIYKWIGNGKIENVTRILNHVYLSKKEITKMSRRRPN